MFQLTREVRFSINPKDDKSSGVGLPTRNAGTNGFGGYPAIAGFGRYLCAQVSLQGELDQKSQYLINIRDIDQDVRQLLPALEKAMDRCRHYEQLARLLFELMREKRPNLLKQVALKITPMLMMAINAEEYPMMRLSQKFEFSASHRLHNPALSDADNRTIFGKCNNALGHGHNYEVQVNLIGTPDANGLLIAIPEFERVVNETVIDQFDHKHLNAEVPQFKTVIPSVENIAKVIFQLLSPALKTAKSRLYSVVVWETPKTWCEYSE